MLRRRNTSTSTCSKLASSWKSIGIMKGRWRLLHKKTECRLDNIKYAILASIVLHNICTHFLDPCKPRWVLKAKRLSVRNKIRGREQDRNASELNRLKISNWLWSQDL